MALLPAFFNFFMPRSGLTLCFLFLTAWLFSAEPVLIHRLIVKPESKLFIEGKTNISDFTCAIRQYCGSDTLVLHEGGRSARPVFVQGTVGLDASSFDCGMTLITSDFRKTIRATEYPEIVIDFLSFERLPSYDQGDEHFNGILKISLTGVTKLFEVPCIISTKHDGQIHLIGERTLSFSDFKLTPPTRMFGSVKVQENLKVKFHLVLGLDPNG